MKFRSSESVLSDLQACGVPREDALVLSLGAGLKGTAARDFVTQNGLPALTPSQELRLFEREYARAEKDTRRIAESPRVTSLYGKTDWERLDPRIREVTVDLLYRGDYTEKTRAFLQEAIVGNDIERFTEIMRDKALWGNVPADRFRRRVAFLETPQA